ncbi:MAG TPA: hypothetical protein VHA82_14560 [Ramlibacter sp.]|uniref:hypothetical protein n=1 Tax=Ramlibacter sp. TaxID=1917967 RepID=UPI002C1338CB|nr:hypothetical protein [Ramlibacter sp.]HVZ45029.1 hypothetical protein [Ramlibacter sp.]
MSDRMNQEIDRLIANGNRLIEEAQEALERSKRFYAERGIDPGKIMELVRLQGGEEAVREVEAEVEAVMQQIREEAERRQLHERPQRPPARAPRTARKMV